MPDSERTSAQVIVEEIRRQVGLQVSAAEGFDTKAMAVFAGAAAVAAFIAPRVTIDTPWRVGATIVTFAFLLAALACLLLSIQPRIGGFSNGPDASQLGARVDGTVTQLDRDLADSFVKVRNQNETFLQAKAGWMIKALRLLFASVVGLAVMVTVGAIA